MERVTTNLPENFTPPPTPPVTNHPPPPNWTTLTLQKPEPPSHLGEYFQRFVEMIISLFVVSRAIEKLFEMRSPLLDIVNLKKPFPKVNEKIDKLKQDDGWKGKLRAEVDLVL